MLISYNWLQELENSGLSPAELAEKLTSAGLTVEGIDERTDDFIFDIDLTSNRPDCLSHLGVSREVRAAAASDLIVEPHPEEFRESANSSLVKIEAADLCHRFTARIIKDVKIGPSPDWLKNRLESLGERSINNVADITNYVMLELGQPMHAFDLSKLAQNRIVVRRAKTGETIKTLDEVERKLDDSMLAICDAEKPVAVAGIMGGFDSSISEATTDVLLEVAYFDRASIRATSRTLNLATEASYRFERGVDIENLKRASDRATGLIIELAGGDAAEFVDVYPRRFEAKIIRSNDLSSSVKRLTGLDVSDKEIERILTALGIESRSDEGERVYIAPSWRHDIEIEEDLVEEVARIVGYDKIEDRIPPATSSGSYQPWELRKKSLRQTLANHGFDEAISYSFIDTKHDEVFDLIPGLVDDSITDKFISLRDSIIEGSTRMRPTLLPGLVDAVRVNFNQQNRDLKLFEIGKVFAASRSETGLPTERELLAIAMTGSEMLAEKAFAVRPLDFYDLKGAVEIALDAINIGPLEFQPADCKHLEKGKSASVALDGRVVGYLGFLNSEIAARYKFKQPVMVAELDLQTLLEASETQVFYQPLPKFPAIVRDVSLLINRKVSFFDIKTAIRSKNFELLKKIEYVDVYEGKGVADDERSLTVRLVYRSSERTLLEEEVETVHQKVLTHLGETCNARLRF